MIYNILTILAFVFDVLWLSVIVRMEDERRDRHPCSSISYGPPCSIADSVVNDASLPASEENSWYLNQRKLGGVKVHRVKGYPSLFPRRF